MRLYFGLIQLAAWLGHKKARLLIAGQQETIERLTAAEEEGLFGKSKHKGKVIWIHAASVGEFEQARPVIERLREDKFPCTILLTFFSPSGYELRKNYDKVDGVMYLPFATKENANRFLDVVKPDMAIMVKYEFWPAYLKALKQRGITTYLISAIFRENQLFFKPWGKPYLRLLTCFSQLFVQDENSKILLEKHGIENVSVAGDTRFDRVTAVAAQSKELPLVEGFVKVMDDITPEFMMQDNRRVIVAGSTWPKDEVMLARYVEEHEDVRLVLVPHEIDDAHLHQIFQIFKGRYIRYTEATRRSVTHCRVLVVDTIGLLSSIYRYANAAYIGGGFGAGIHNTIEAAVYGVPVVFGKRYQHFREAHGLIACGAGRSVKNYREMEAALDEALMCHEQMGQQAKAYVESELGATEIIVTAVKKETASPLTEE